MDREERLAPGQVLVVDVVGLVVEHDEVLQRLEPLQHRALAGSGQILARLLAQQRLDRILRRPFLIARFVELVDVGKKEVARCVRLGGLSAQNHLLLKRRRHSGGTRGSSWKIRLLAKSFSSRW